MERNLAGFIRRILTGALPNRRMRLERNFHIMGELMREAAAGVPAAANRGKQAS